MAPPYPKYTTIILKGCNWKVEISNRSQNCRLSKGPVLLVCVYLSLLPHARRSPTENETAFSLSHFCESRRKSIKSKVFLISCSNSPDLEKDSFPPHKSSVFRGSPLYFVEGLCLTTETALWHYTAWLYNLLGSSIYGSRSYIFNSTNAIELRIGPAELADWTLLQRFLRHSCDILTCSEVMLPEKSDVPSKVGKE